MHQGSCNVNSMLVSPCHRENDTGMGSLTPVGCKEYWVSRTECVNRVCKSTGLPSSLTTFLICFQAALESSAVTLWVRADRPLTVLLSRGALSESTWSACHLRTVFLSPHPVSQCSWAALQLCTAYLPGGAAYAVAIFSDRQHDQVVDSRICYDSPAWQSLPRSHPKISAKPLGFPIQLNL